jgi:hypothetical protein
MELDIELPKSREAASFTLSLDFLRKAMQSAKTAGLPIFFVRIAFRASHRP